tara:strand:- start:124 stop:516 length:393 start_codon:yes stop_codon:yes gene_type:complete
MILIIGALLGFFSVAFGAYSEHGLRPNVSDEEFRMLMTAIRYNQVHALIISVLGLITLPSSFLNIHLFRRSGFLFILGTILFSFSIYSSVGLQIPSLLYLTPVGGITLMVSWLSLAYAAYKFQKSSDFDA